MLFLELVNFLRTNYSTVENVEGKNVPRTICTSVVRQTLMSKPILTRQLPFFH